MFFRDIIGQNDIKSRLLSSVNEGFIPHAQLFCGPEGVGKLPLALAYAQYLNCTDRQDGDSCGKCPSCVKYGHLAHPDLHFVFPTVKKEKEKSPPVCDDYIAEWREFFGQNAYFNLRQWLAHIGAENAQGLIYERESEEIIRKLSLKIYEAKYKTMLIWMPEKMNRECANKLLKIIEEPTPDTVFLLVSDNPDNIIGTIQSRSQRVNIRGVADEDIIAALEQKYSITPQDAALVAHIARGSYLKAMELVSLDKENKAFFNLFSRLMRAAIAPKGAKVKKAISDEIAQIGRESQKAFLGYAQRLVREYFVSNLNRPDMVYLNNEEAQFGVRFAPYVNERNITGFMDEFALAERHIEQNVNPKMVFLDLCLKVTMLFKK
ncbi:MAG: DNA polymerase III subunit delta' [Prevotella sp.]|jgi:DNA polymerase-3 subunit delta'|nr:DNA polymerase III subunit delta' [Prevotella sp.]